MKKESNQNTSWQTEKPINDNLGRTTVYFLSWKKLVHMHPNSIAILLMEKVAPFHQHISCEIKGVTYLFTQLQLDK